MHKLAQIYQNAPSAQTYTEQYCKRLSDLLAQLDFGVVEKIIETMNRAREEGNALYFMANGGSAAVASHWVNDLVAGGFVEGQKPWRAFCLTDNVESVTAIGNDMGFEHIFSHQLRTCVQPGDVVYAMSVSGNSENIIRGIAAAREKGATTIGICGFDGGRLKDCVDIALHIATTPDEYGPVEDIFAILDHLVTGYLTMRQGKWLHH